MIRSNRNVYIAGHVTKAVRDTLKQAIADRRKSGDRTASRSRFIADAVKQKLIDDGYTIQEEPEDKGPELPFDGPCPNDPFNGKRADRPCMCDTCLHKRVAENYNDEHDPGACKIDDCKRCAIYFAAHERLEGITR